MTEHDCIQTGLIKELKERIESWNSIRDVIIKMELIVEQQSKHSDKQDRIIDELLKATNSLNVAVTKQNEILEKLEKSNHETKEKFNQIDLKMMETEKKIDINYLEHLRRNSFNVMDFIVNKLIPLLLTAGIVWFLINADKIKP